MIVPILFSLDDYSFADKVNLRPFYSFLYFCYQNNYPVIAQEEYLELPENYLQNEKMNYIFTEESKKQWNFDVLTKDQFNSIKKYIITDKMSKALCKEYENKSKAHLDILKKTNEKFKDILIKEFNQIEKDYKKKIDAVLVWVSNPSIINVCNEKNIKVIQMEMSPIREPSYKETLGYCCLNSKYDIETVKKQYAIFKEKINKDDLLSRDEILSLFLKECDKNILNKRNKSKEYDLGIALSMPEDYFYSIYATMTHEDIIEKAVDLTEEERISYRFHPGMKYNIGNKANIDNSPSSKEWIMKCNSIVSGVSNVCFEAMLFGNNVITLSDEMPWSFMCQNHLSYLDSNVVELEFINFMIFFYFVPFELLFNKKYLKDRFFSNKSIIDIYKYNRDFILEKKGLTNEIFNEKFINRKKLIISKCFQENSDIESIKIEETKKGNLLKRIFRK